MATSPKTTKTATTGKTRTRKSTAAGKTPSAAKATAKTKPTGVTDTPAARPEAPPAPVFKMQELMQALEGKSELKRAELRQTVGHVLEALGAALAEGNDVSLPGFGKITAKRREPKPGGEQIIARIKLNIPDPDPVRTAVPGEE